MKKIIYYLNIHIRYKQALYFLIPYTLYLIPFPSFSQQDPQYSQYMFNHLAINPAYAGSREALAITMLVRNQWTEISGAPKTRTLSAQMPLKNKRIGLGAEIINDAIGPKNIFALLGSYAYRFRIQKGKFALGLKAGFYRYAFDWNKMYYKDSDDPYFVNNPKEITPQFTLSGDFGMYYYTRTFYWGMAWTHLNSGDVVSTNAIGPNAKQSIHFFMPMGKAIQVGNTVINPALLIKGGGSGSGQLDLSLNVLIKERLWLGMSLRSEQQSVFLVQYLINDKLKAGISFDNGRKSNKIVTHGGATVEFMIGYDINILGTKMMMPRFL